MTTYEAITVVLQSNLVLVGVLSLIMLIVANKKK